MKKILFTKDLYLLKIRLLWVFLIFFIVALFLFFRVVPGGQVVYQKKYPGLLRSGQGFIYSLGPVERIAQEKLLNSRIVAEPVYFSVFSPRTFNQVKLTIDYSRHLNIKSPIIEAGVLVDGITKGYNLVPIENRLIDSLSDSWQRLGLDPLVLQADNYYDSSEAFFTALNTGKLKACPEGLAQCLAVYNYEPDYRLEPNFNQAEKALEINMPLRGTHSLYLHTDSDHLELELGFRFLNLDKSLDDIILILSQANEIIKTENYRQRDQDEEEKVLNLLATDLSPGVYKLEIKIKDDVVIKHMKSSTNRLVFISRLWPVSYNQEIKVYTDKNYLFLRTLEPASLQQFIIAGQSYELKEPYSKEEFRFDNDDGKSEIILGKDDVILENSGVFALDPSVIFNPQYNRIDQYFTPSATVKYIIANYQPPEQIKTGLYRQSIDLDLKHSYRENKQYNFIISIPNLSLDSEGYVDIKKIKLELSGRSLWQKLFNKE